MYIRLDSYLDEIIEKYSTFAGIWNCGSTRLDTDFHFLITMYKANYYYIKTSTISDCYFLILSFFVRYTLCRDKTRCLYLQWLVIYFFQVQLKSIKWREVILLVTKFAGKPIYTIASLSSKRNKINICDI